LAGAAPSLSGSLDSYTGKAETAPSEKGKIAARAERCQQLNLQHPLGVNPMAMDPTPPSESAPEPNALPATADDHVALTGNMTIGSMATGGLTVRSDTPLPLRMVDPGSYLSNWWDAPQPRQPPRPSVPFDPGGPAEPPFPPPTTSVVADAGGGIEITTALGAGRLETLDDAVSVGEITISLSVPAVDIVERRIAKAPDLYALLAANAAREIRAAINDLDAQKPNEPAALSGYKQVNRVLTKLATDFELVATEIDDAVAAANPETKIARLRKVAETFVEMFDGFVGWFNEHAHTSGRVVAHLGLAGTISGALTYFADVPAALAFPATIAALNGENIWEAIKLFAPGGDSSKK
jgi:hypothetical protein